MGCPKGRGGSEGGRRGIRESGGGRAEGGMRMDVAVVAGGADGGVRMGVAATTMTASAAAVGQASGGAGGWGPAEIEMVFCWRFS